MCTSHSRDIVTYCCRSWSCRILASSHSKPIVPTDKTSSFTISISTPAWALSMWLWMISMSHGSTLPQIVWLHPQGVLAGHVILELILGKLLLDHFTV